MALYARFLLCALSLLVAGCAGTVSVPDAASYSDDQAATILGGSHPKVRSVDRVAVNSRIPVLNPDVKVPPGPRDLVIDFQSCSTADLCALVSVAARVDLQPGRSYVIRQQAEDCSLWLALTTIVRSEPRACRNDFWIEDSATGERIWQGAPDEAAG